MQAGRVVKRPAQRTLAHGPRLASLFPVSFQNLRCQRLLWAWVPILVAAINHQVGHRLVHGAPACHDRFEALAGAQRRAPRVDAGGGRGGLLGQTREQIAHVSLDVDNHRVGAQRGHFAIAQHLASVWRQVHHRATAGVDQRPLGQRRGFQNGHVLQVTKVRPAASLHYLSHCLAGRLVADERV